ncbi:ABC transporter permease [Hasllibacter halocynthiae]|nr:ABC transporter permease [Hasllibacter halocynthiae]
MALLYAPIALLPIFAFNDGQVIAFPLQGFSTRWFEGLWTNRTLHSALWNSLVVAVISSVLAVVLGICAARASARYAFRGQGAVMGMIMVPLVLPEIIVGVSVLIVVNTVLGLPLGLWAVIAAHVLICTPFAVAVLSGAFQSLDPAMEEAARDLGETPWGAFRTVTLPLVAPGIVASLLICFTISLDEFIIAFFLTGASPTLPVYIWGLLRFPADLPIVMALGTLLVLASIVLLTMAEIFRRRGAARAGRKDSGGFL